MLLIAENNIDNNDTNNMDSKLSNGKKSTTPKDPLYFKKYYQEKLKGVKHHCDICNKDIAKEKKARHANTRLHMRKLKESLCSNYSEFD